MEVRKSPVDWRLIVAITLILVGVALRLLPHIPNVTPVGAIALFGGAVLGWRLSIWLPLLVMMLSDMIIGFYEGIVFTWAGFLLVALYGGLLRRRSLLMKVLAGAFGSSVIFYVVSNFGVWLTSGMYAPTPEGLVQCYIMGLPFFRLTLVGDMLFSLVFFGLYQLAWRWMQLQSDPVRISA